MRIFIFTVLILLSCANESGQKKETPFVASGEQSFEDTNLDYDTLTKTIHIFVALCDNKYQGIVPVGRMIGNGQDSDNNLYWGCGFGIRTYFKRSKE